MSDINFEYLKKLSGFKSIPRGSILKIEPKAGPYLRLSEYSLILAPNDEKSWIFDVKIMNLGSEATELVGINTPDEIAGAIQITSGSMPILIKSGEMTVLTFEFDKTTVQSRSGKITVSLEAEGIGTVGLGDTPPLDLDIEYDASIRGGPLLSIAQDLADIDLGRVPLYGGHKFSCFAPEGKSVALKLLERPDLSDPIQMDFKNGSYVAMVALTDGVVRYFFEVDGEPHLDPTADKTAIVRPHGQVSEKELKRLHYTVPLENIGDKVLQSDAHSDERWLSIDSISKTVPPGERGKIRLKIATEFLKKGKNEATLLISTNAKGKNKNRTIKFSCEGDIEGPHLKVEGEPEINFGKVLMGGEHEQSITLFNQGTELLQVELRDPRELIRSRSIEILPGDRFVLHCALDSVDIDEAGENEWEVLLLSNSSIHPYGDQRVRCAANVITLGLANQVETLRKVFYTEKDALTLIFRRSDDEPIDVQLEDPPGDMTLSTTKLSDHEFKVTLPAGVKQQDREFHLSFVDSESKVLKYDLALNYQIVAATAELFLDSPRKTKAKSGIAAEVGIKNTSDQPLKIFDVKRQGGGVWSYLTSATAQQKDRQRVIAPGGQMTISCPLELTRRDRWVSYKTHSDRLTIRLNDRADTTPTFDLNVVTVPEFSKPKRFAVSFFLAILMAIAAYATYNYGPKRGVVPYPGNIVEQIKGSDCNIDGVEMAYQQASVLSGEIRDLQALISCFGLVATRHGQRKIVEIEENLDTVAVWTKLIRNELPDSTHRMNADDVIDAATPEGVAALPVPAIEREPFDDALAGYLLSGVSKHMRTVDIRMRPASRTSINDKRSAELLTTCSHRLSLAKALPGNEDVISGYESKIEEYEKIIATTAHLAFEGLPGGSQIAVDGGVKVNDTSKGGNKVIVPNNSSVDVRITNRYFYPYSNSIESPKSGTKSVKVAMKPREGTVTWRPKDSNQPSVESVAAVSGKEKRSVYNGQKLPPGKYELEMKFDNEGVRTYGVEVRSLRTTTIEFECQIGTLRVRTKPVAKIFRIDESGGLVPESENGEAFIQDYFGEVTVKCVPIHSIYQDTVLTVMLNQTKQDLNIRLRMK
jgi:hypothetical protein